MTTSLPTQTQIKDKTVRLSATLRAAAGGKAITVPLASGATVRDLLQAIEDAHPKLAAKLLDASRGLTPGTQILVDGKHIDWLEGLDTPVDDADDLMLVPPLSGG